MLGTRVPNLSTGIDLELEELLLITAVGIPFQPVYIVFYVGGTNRDVMPPSIIMLVPPHKLLETHGGGEREELGTEHPQKYDSVVMWAAET